MEEIELKHLAIYLPYNLSFIRVDGTSIDGVEKCTLSAIYSTNDTLSIQIAIELQHIYKPILRPLDEFMLLQDGTMFFSPYTIDTVDMDGGIKANINSIPYQDFIWLVSNHFDVFGLIDSGLAVDINTLSPNVAGNP